MSIFGEVVMKSRWCDRDIVGCDSGFCGSVVEPREVSGG